MAQQLIEISLPNGSTALARVSAPEGGGAEKVAFPKLDFDEVSRCLEGMAMSIKGALDQVAPDKVVVDFGLELAVKNGKLSGLLVEGAGTGSLSITLEWAR